jgi:acyl-CoA dehydrogenase
VTAVRDFGAHAPAPPAPRRPIPPFTEEHEEFRQVVRRFVERELAPHAREWEEAKWFPNEVFAKLAEHGYLGLKFSVEYGGSDDQIADAVFAEELSRCGSGGVAAGIGAHVSIASPPVAKFGTEEQKQRYLVPAIRGEKIGALGITEPDAGSDVASIRTAARRVEGGWLVSGSKMFITNGMRADFMVTAVKTSAEGGHQGLSFVIVDTDRDGFEASPIEKLGWHASDTALIAMDDVFVPEENLLGEEGRGFYLIMANFQWERLLMALGSVGAMQRVFERTLDFAKERHAFGRPIGSHQIIRHQFAEMATAIEAGRDLTYHALRLYVNGIDAVREVTMAKLATQRACFDLMDRCLQIHGGAGYMVECDMERAARDARLGPIGGGTDEIMKEILGKSLGL